MNDELPPPIVPEASLHKAPKGLPVADGAEIHSESSEPDKVTEATSSLPPRRGSVAAALFFGLVFGALIVSGMWFYQYRNSYFYQVQSNSSVLAKPRDIQQVLAHAEPATVAITINGDAASAGSAGTGFIYSSDGVVVTNDHVVEGVKGRIIVTLGDGRSFVAKLLGSDPLQDLAVLKVEAKGLPFVKLGKSSEIKVGDDVIAIGNALALEGGLSVTRGIISGLDRTIDTEANTQLQGIMQTDAAINRGNSGGPLVNSKGEVIGINTAIANPIYSQNIGFAIAIDNAKPVIEDLRQGRSRKIAFIGIAALDVNDRLARELSLKVDEGALIVEIQAQSPASKTELQLDDVLVKINGKKIKNAQDMVTAIRSKKPGDEVSVTYNRAGKEKTIKVTLVERPV